MIRLVIYMLLVLFCSNESIGQELVTYTKLEYFNRLRSKSTNYRQIAEGIYIPYKDAIKEYKEINGSPYLFKDCVYAELKDQHNNNFDSLKLNFDLHYKELVILDVKGRLMVIEKKLYPKFRVYDTNNLFRLRIHDDGVSYHQILFETKEFAFVKIHKSKLVESTKVILSVENTTRKFVRKEHYYLDLKGEFSKVKLSKKSIQKKLPKRLAQKWKKATKNVNYKLKSEKDYIKLMQETFDS